jgi:amino acid permease
MKSKNKLSNIPVAMMNIFKSFVGAGLLGLFND